jgi:hypothetical protein
MLVTLLISALAVAAATAQTKTDQARADSVQALRVILSSELQGGNQVLKLENQRLADSLVRGATSRRAFLERIGDSSVSRRFRHNSEFADYWGKLEAREGIVELKSQYAAHDVDKTRIPKAYLFDSTVVVYPGWIILRRMRR